jgi:hypothetical protein
MDTLTLKLAVLSNLSEQNLKPEDQKELAQWYFDWMMEECKPKESEEPHELYPVN